MITMESYQFALLQLRNQKKALIAFLTLHKVHFFHELRTCRVNLIVFFVTLIHLIIVVLNEELA